MKLSLRELFWLVLIAGIIVGWGLERSKIIGRWRELQKNPGSRFGHTQQKSNPTALLASIQALNREELLAKLKTGPQDVVFDMHLLEAVRRGWGEELKSGYQEYMTPERAPRGTNAAWTKPPNSMMNLEYLTAVRRSEGQPDPIKISFRSLGKDSTGKAVSYPYINPQVENVDVENERINYMQGGGEDYDQWKVRLTIEQGVAVEETNYTPKYFRTQTSQQTHIRNATTVVSKKFYLDARAYLRPPPTGRYRLELFFSERRIAYDSDLSHRLTWKSAPIDVLVINRARDTKWQLIIAPLVVLTLASGVLSTAIVRSVRQKRFLRRNDWIALSIVVLLTTGWAINVFHIQSEIENNTSDANAEWTMRLVE